MKRKLRRIMLTNLPENEQPPMFANYTHYRLVEGGVMISSDKGLGLGKIYLPNAKIAWILS